MLSFVKCTPPDLPGGTVTQIKVTLTTAAPTGGVPVVLTGLPTGPLTIVVPAGLLTRSETYLTPLRDAAEACVVTATEGTTVRSTLLVVRPSIPDVVAFGGSGTSGQGLLSPVVEAWPGRLQEIIINTAGLTPRVINGGRPGRTSTDGLSEITPYWTPTARVLILDLGANDLIKGIPLATTRSNLATLITAAQSRNMGVVLCGQSSMGDTYTAMFADLAAQYGTALVPDVAVGFVDGDRQADHHPTVSGHIKEANTIWSALAPLLGA